MFCPKCSQQQTSDEARFCSRCGFQLGVVKAALAADESVDVRAAAAATPADRSTRVRDLTLGAALMFFIALAIAVATLDVPPISPAPVVLLVVWWALLTLALNLRPLLRYFFGDLFRRTKHNEPAQRFAPDLTTKVSASARNAALPPTNAGEPIPASLFGARRANTAEVAPPPSVADHTTNLLG